jgi:hypothetical protein
MSRPLGVVCAGVLLAAVAGCSPSAFLAAFAGPGGKQQVVAGSIDEVSARLQASLNNLNIQVKADRQGQDVIKLTGRTKTGKLFYLSLKRQKTAQGESTAIMIDWDQEADEGFWQTLVQVMITPTPRPGNPATPG